MEIFIGIVVFAAVVFLIVKLRRGPKASKGPAPVDNPPSDTDVQS